MNKFFVSPSASQNITLYNVDKVVNLNFISNIPQPERFDSINIDIVRIRVRNGKTKLDILATTS